MAIVLRREQEIAKWPPPKQLLRPPTTAFPITQSISKIVANRKSCLWGGPAGVVPLLGVLPLVPHFGVFQPKYAEGCPVMMNQTDKLLGPPICGHDGADFAIGRAVQPQRSAPIPKAQTHGCKVSPQCPTNAAADVLARGTTSWQTSRADCRHKHTVNGSP